MKTQSAKAKGRKLQQEVRDDILKEFSIFGFRQDDIKSTSMGAGGEDIQFSPFARDFLPWSIECKRNARFAIYKQFEQAINNCPKDCNPVLVIRGDRKQKLVVLEWDYFLKLNTKLIKLENET